MISKKKYRKELFEALAATVLIALVLRLLVFGIYKVPSASMLPNLEVGDLVLSINLPYGVRNPFTGRVLISGTAPKAGAVVVIRDPQDPSYLFARRIVAVAGDKVRIEKGEVFVNDQSLRVGSESPGALPKPDYPFAKHSEPFRERIQSHEYWTYYQLPDLPEEQASVVVPPGQVYVLPDYRTLKGDGGLAGLIPESAVSGRVRLVFASFNFDRSLGPIPSIRWSRLFTLIR